MVLGTFYTLSSKITLFVGEDEIIIAACPSLF